MVNMICYKFLVWGDHINEHTNQIMLILTLRGGLASRLFTEQALGGIIFSQMLTPTGERHESFQTGSPDITEPKDQTFSAEITFFYLHWSQFHPKFKWHNCLSHKLDLTWKEMGFFQLRLVSANAPYFPKILK